MKNYESLSHTRYDCKYHVVFIPKYRRKKIYGAIRRHLGEIFAGYAAVALALILDPSCGLFSDAARALSATRSPPLAQTWHSKIGIRDENRK